MGGQVRVVVREEDETVHSFVTWTNSIAHALKEASFFEGDLSGVFEHIDYYAGLKQDYLENQSTGKYVYRDSPYYGVHSFVQTYPVEYGVIVVDFKTKKIYDRQDYTNLQSVHGSFARKKDGTVSSISKHMSLEEGKFNNLISKKYIPEAEVYFDNKFNTIDVSSATDLESLVDIINTELNNKNIDSLEFMENGLYLINFTLKIKNNFSYKKYKSPKTILSKMLEIGFEISSEDQQKWKDFK